MSYDTIMFPPYFTCMLLQILSFLLLSIILLNHFHKVEFIVVQNIFNESYKYARLIHKIIKLCGRKITSINMIFYSLELYGATSKSCKGFTISKSEKRLFINSKPEQKQALDLNTLKTDFLTDHRMFEQRDTNVQS